MKCPKCGIRAAKHAVSCFCGYEFVKNDTPKPVTPVTEEETEQKYSGEDGQEADQSEYAPESMPESLKEEPEEPLSTPSPQSREETAGTEENGANTGSSEYSDTGAGEAEETEQTSSRFENGVQRYDRVGGWLLLLCILLTILGPLATVYSLTAGYSQLESLFDATPGLRTFYNMNFVLNVGLGLFSLWAGFSLWVRLDGAVERAKKYLYARLGYLAILYFLPTMSGLPEEMSAQIQSDIASVSIFSVFYVGVWYMYLTKSKRVRGTYPRTSA